MSKLMAMVSELADLTRDDAAAYRVHELEGLIIDAVPRTRSEASAIIAVASTWMLADADTHMLERAHAAMKRVAAFLGGVPGAAAIYYGIQTSSQAAAA